MQQSELLPAVQSKGEKKPHLLPVRTKSAAQLYPAHNLKTAAPTCCSSLHQVWAPTQPDRVLTLWHRVLAPQDAAAAIGRGMLPKVTTNAQTQSRQTPQCVDFGVKRRVSMQETLKATSRVQLKHIYPSDCSTDVCIIEMRGGE